jgi:hypothetical protein
MGKSFMRSGCFLAAGAAAAAAEEEGFDGVGGGWEIVDGDDEEGLEEAIARKIFDC